MPRRLKVKTREKGDLELFAFTEDATGCWELEFEALRRTPFGRLISRVPRSAFHHVLNGLSQPLVDALGLPPEGALLKLPRSGCSRRTGCALYDKRRCTVMSKKLSWCFAPAGLGALTEAELRVASSVVFLWKDGVYVIAVYPDE